MKNRLDIELVRRKIARSRDDARELIAAGHVLINGLPATKASTLVGEEASIATNVERETYVSRGARKLIGALESFGVTSFAGRNVLDAGASTGGFTDVALRKGALHVFAVDVGYGQLAWTLQKHPQVTVLDRTNIRDLSVDRIGNRVDVIIADLSFISLVLVLPKLVELIELDGEMFLMVKPQFEVGKDLLGEGGVVQDKDLRAQAVRKVAEAAFLAGWGVKGVVASPLPGPAGNVEYFLWLRAGEDQLRESDLEKAIEEGPK